MTGEEGHNIIQDGRMGMMFNYACYRNAAWCSLDVRGTKGRNCIYSATLIWGFRVQSTHDNSPFVYP
jgi:hypothetical protein